MRFGRLLGLALGLLTPIGTAAADPAPKQNTPEEMVQEITHGLPSRSYITAQQLRQVLTDFSQSVLFANQTGIGLAPNGFNGVEIDDPVPANLGGTGTAILGGTNTLLYTQTQNVMAAIAAANDGVLITSHTGVPSISSVLPGGLSIPNVVLTGTPTISGFTAGVLQSGSDGSLSSTMTLPSALTIPSPSISNQAILGSNYTSTISPGVFSAYGPWLTTGGIVTAWDNGSTVANGPPFNFFSNESLSFADTSLRAAFVVQGLKTGTGTGSRSAGFIGQTCSNMTPTGYCQGFAAGAIAEVGSINTGNYAGENPFVLIPDGMNVNFAVVSEMDSDVNSDVGLKEGLRIVDYGTASGTNVDAAVGLVKLDAAIGFKYGLLFSGDASNNEFPLHAGGTLIAALSSGTFPYQLASGFDVSKFSGGFSGPAIWLSAQYANNVIGWNDTTGAFSSSAGASVFLDGSNNLAVLDYSGGAIYFGQSAISPILVVRPTGVSITGAPPSWSSYTTQYQPGVFNLGGLPITAMFSGFAPGGYTSGGQSTALIGAIDTPSSDTSCLSDGVTTDCHNANAGIAGIARSASTQKGSIGVFGGAMPNAGDVESFSANFVATNFPYLSGTTPGFAAFTSIGVEIDIYLNNPSSGSLTGKAEGLKIAGQMASIPSGGAYGIEIAPANTVATLGWTCAICIDDAPNSIGISLGATGPAGANVGSQAIAFRSYFSSSPIQASISVDGSSFLNLSSPVGLVADVNGTQAAVISVTKIALGAPLSSAVAPALSQMWSGDTQNWVSVFNGATASNTVSEGEAVWRLTSTNGAGTSNYKIVTGCEMTMNAGSGNGYCTNDVLTINTSVGNQSGIAHEIDFNNFNEEYPLPNQAGYLGSGILGLGLNMASGGSTHPGSAAIYFGTLPVTSYAWRAGLYFFGSTLIEYYTLYDGSNSQSGYFDAGSHQVGINLSGATYSVNAIQGTGFAISPAGLGEFSGLVSTSTIQSAGYTVATLPSAGTKGRTAYVTDASACASIGTAPTGGGTTACPVFDTGASWVIN